MPVELRIEESPLELRCARLRDSRLEALALHFHDSPPQRGAVLLGRVLGRPGRGGGALVDLGDAQPGLCRNALGPEGQAVCVQIRRDAMDGKGVRVAGAVSLVTPALVARTGGGRPGLSPRLADSAERDRLQALVARESDDTLVFTARTLAAGLDDELLQRQAGLLRDRWRTITEAAATARPPALLEAPPSPLIAFLNDHLSADVDRVRIEGADTLARATGFARVHLPWLEERLESWRESEALFALDDLEEQIAGLFAPAVPLPGGGHLLIEQTAALATIDVNAGAAAPAEANLAAVEEIPRQLALRGLAGQIAIDFAGGRGRTSGLAGRLKAALARQRVAAEIVGDLPRAGLVVLSRRKDGPPLAARRHRAGASTAHPRHVAAAAARQAARELRASPAGGLVLWAGPGTAAVLEAEAAAIERSLGHALTVRSDSGLGDDHYEIERSGA